MADEIKGGDAVDFAILFNFVSAFLARIIRDLSQIDD